MANPLPPIPNDQIGENHRWREWLFNLGRYIQIAQTGGSPWTVPQGGTGVGSITGYVKGNGVNPITATSSIPSTDISGLGTMAVQNTTSYVQSSYATAPSNITVGASPFTYHNTQTYPVDVITNAGTVSVIAFSRDNATYYTTGYTTGIVTLSPGDYLKVTYTVAPTMTAVPR